MNIHDLPSASEAKIKYLDADFRVIKPGTFVKCAITGKPISIEEPDSEALQAIAVQLQEIEAEVNRLSLLVNKIVLERQALALQQQLENLSAMAQITQEETGEASIEGSEDTIVAVEHSEIAAGVEDLADEVLIEGNVADELSELPIPIVAINEKTGQILAIGHEAKRMVGKTPSHIIATRPLVKGVISDFEVTEQMLKYFIEKAYQRKFIISPGPRVIVGIPFGVTEVEKKAVRDAGEKITEDIKKEVAEKLDALKKAKEGDRIG